MAVRLFLFAIVYSLAAIEIIAQGVEFPRIFVNDREVLTGTYTNFGPANISMSGYPGGRIYYTTDGSEPSILSTEYFWLTLTNDMTLRVVAYSADFSESSTRSVHLFVDPLYYIRFSGPAEYAEYSVDGGLFRLVTSVPNRLIYTGAGQSLTLRATDAGGWFFDRWKGDHASLERTNTFTVTESEEIHLTMHRTNRFDAVFANGRVEASPPPPYSSDGNRVQLTAIPDPGYTFAGWLNGGGTPISYSQLAHLPGKVPQFAPLPPRTHSLTVKIEGNGVLVYPPRYAFTNGETATLSVRAEPGWIFDHWSGDLNSSNAFVHLQMNGDKTVVAHFKRLLLWSPTFWVQERGAPAVGVDGALLAVDGTTLRAYNREGFTKWEVPLAGQPGFPPVVAPDGTIFILGAHAESQWYLQAFSKGGRLLWQRDLGNEWVRSIALSENGLYLGVTEGPTVSLRRSSFGGETLGQVADAGDRLALDRDGNLRSFRFLPDGASSLVAHSSDLTPLWSLPPDNFFSQHGVAIDLIGRTFFVRSHVTWGEDGSGRGSDFFGGATISGERFWEDFYESGFRPGIWSSLGVDRVFMNEAGTFAAIDSNTGATVWSRTAPSGETFDGSVAAADGSVFVVVQRNPGTVLQKISPLGQLTWETTIDASRGEPSYPILTDDGILYISGASLGAYDVGVGPAPSGWPMARANWRNTGQAFTGTMPGPAENRLVARQLADGGIVLEFTPSDSSSFLLQKSEGLSEWSTLQSFSGQLEYLISRRTAGSRFFRIIAP